MLSRMPGATRNGKLQWSRAQESAEISPAPAQAMTVAALQWSRAQESAEIGTSIRMPERASCFNGAALKRARKLKTPEQAQWAEEVLQWSRAQESAEMDSSRPERTSRPCSFNGAALKRARKSGTSPRTASGPCRFNGAALKRARKLPTLTPPARSSGSFNGAALKRARKCGEPNPAGMDVLASMEPRSRERGNRRHRHRHRLAWRASMEPRSRERGNRGFRDHPPRKRLLQWSRAQESAEIAEFSSTTPCPLTRFNGAALKRARKLPVASRGHWQSFWLQWSRAQESAEIGLSRRQGRRDDRFNGAALKRARK